MCKHIYKCRRLALQQIPCVDRDHDTVDLTSFGATPVLHPLALIGRDLIYQCNGAISDGKDSTPTLDKRRQAQERLAELVMGVGQNSCFGIAAIAAKKTDASVDVCGTTADVPSDRDADASPTFAPPEPFATEHNFSRNA